MIDQKRAVNAISSAITNKQGEDLLKAAKMAVASNLVAYFAALVAAGRGDMACMSQGQFVNHVVSLTEEIVEKISE